MYICVDKANNVWDRHRDMAEFKVKVVFFLDLPLSFVFFFLLMQNSCSSTEKS